MAPVWDRYDAGEGPVCLNSDAGCTEEQDWDPNFREFMGYCWRCINEGLTPAPSVAVVA